MVVDLKQITAKENSCQSIAMIEAFGVRPDILTFATNAYKSILTGKYQNIRPDTNGSSALHVNPSVFAVSLIGLQGCL